MTDTPAQPFVELVGVYDADGGIRGEVSYVVGHLLHRRECALCDITHTWRRKPAWDAMVGTPRCPGGAEASQRGRRGPDGSARLGHPAGRARPHRRGPLASSADARRTADRGRRRGGVREAPSGEAARLAGRSVRIRPRVPVIGWMHARSDASACPPVHARRRPESVHGAHRHGAARRAGGSSDHPGDRDRTGLRGLHERRPGRPRAGVLPRSRHRRARRPDARRRRGGRHRPPGPRVDRPRLHTAAAPRRRRGRARPRLLHASGSGSGIGLGRAGTAR